jgi:hypothetical protein
MFLRRSRLVGGSRLIFPRLTCRFDRLITTARRRLFDIFGRLDRVHLHRVHDRSWSVGLWLGDRDPGWPQNAIPDSISGLQDLHTRRAVAMSRSR